MAYTLVRYGPVSQRKPSALQRALTILTIQTSMMEGSNDAFFTAQGCTLVGFLLSIGVLLTTAGFAVRSMGLFRALLWSTMRELSLIHISEPTRPY